MIMKILSADHTELSADHTQSQSHYSQQEKVFYYVPIKKYARLQRKWRVFEVGLFGLFLEKCSILSVASL